ncbi:MAG: hypothetical protein Kow00121_18720 [Elainellaceae cyanobacterium]
MSDLITRLIGLGLSLTLVELVVATSAVALPDPSPFQIAQTPTEQFDLDPELIEDSPTLQRWLEEVPNVRSDIRRDPSFRTRLRIGYSQFPSTDHASGLHIGIEDILIERSGFTVSADYQTAFDADREAYGADLRYYVLPLGSYVNFAPVVGYRSVEGEDYDTDGVNVGFRVLLVPSRTGAADVSFTQTWVAPGDDQEVGVSTLSFGYALTHQMRVSADLQKQNAPQEKDSRVGIGLEWMF